MRISIQCAIMILINGILVQCTDESITVSPEKVQFSCSQIVTNESGGRVRSDEIPTAVLLTLTTDAGDPIFVNKKVNLLQMGDFYLTQPIELLPGNYKVTDFLLIKDSTTILYAVPKSGTRLAPAVNHPLPYTINVRKGHVTNIALDVIAVDQQVPEDFGYASFTLHVVNPLWISVFTLIDEKEMLANAIAYIVNETDTLKTYPLDAKVNLIAFSGSIHYSYKLIVMKNGYNPYVRIFNYQELIEELNGHPLMVRLVPAFTMETYVSVPREISLRLNGSGVLQVDWGDGTFTAFQTKPEGSPWDELIHSYTEAGTFRIAVTGELDKITSFTLLYETAVVDKINFQGLTELSSINFGITPRGPKVIDLRYNKKLESVSVFNIANQEDLLLPDVNHIRSIGITGPNLFTTSDVDAIVNNIYINASRHNERDGRFLLQKSWIDVSEELVGPPSPSSILKLKELRDRYNWLVYPDLP
jgi:hypothetical protein